MSAIQAPKIPRASGRIWRLRAAASHVALGALAFAVFVFLYTPLIVTALFSFNDDSAMTWPIEKFSTKWYHELFADATLWSSVRNSILVAVIGVLISLVLGQEPRSSSTESASSGRARSLPYCCSRS